MSLIGMISAMSLIWAQPGEPERVRDGFVAAVNHCGRTPPFTPGLVAQTGRALILYDVDTRAIYYPLWAELADDQRAAATRAAEVSGLDPEAFFTDTFNSLLIAHELGHWLETIDDRQIDHWSSELQANRIAVAYWRLATRDDAAVELRFAPLLAGLDDAPSPVPEGRTVEDWFNEAPFDPTTYGWYQGRMAEEAWRRRDEVDFCALVDQAWPR